MPRPAYGFTLLELVVVLALLALATALVAPAGFRMIETWRRAGDVEAILDSLSSLGVSALHQGRPLQLDAGPVPPDAGMDLPEGWRLELDEPLVVHANGACEGTRGRMVAGNGYSRDFELLAPFCRPAGEAGQ